MISHPEYRGWIVKFLKWLPVKLFGLTEAEIRRERLGAGLCPDCGKPPAKYGCHSDCPYAYDYP